MSACPYRNDDGHVAHRCPHCSIESTQSESVAQEPIGYAVQMDTGAFVGIWRLRELAESVMNKQPAGHHDRLIEVYAAPQAEHHHPGPATLDRSRTALPAGAAPDNRYVDKPYRFEPHANVQPDDAPYAVVLASLRVCASTWVPEARVLGNVRAGDIVRAITEAESAILNPAPQERSNPPAQAATQAADPAGAGPSAFAPLAERLELALDKVWQHTNLMDEACDGMAECREVAKAFRAAAPSATVPQDKHPECLHATYGSPHCRAWVRLELDGELQCTWKPDNSSARGTPTPIGWIEVDMVEWLREKAPAGGVVSLFRDERDDYARIKRVPVYLASDSSATGPSRQSNARCKAQKYGEFDMLWCCREEGHKGEHNYVVATSDRELDRG